MFESRAMTMGPVHAPVADGAPRFRDLRGLGLGLAAGLALFGGVLFAWGSDHGALAGLLCAAPALIALVLTATSQNDRNQYTIRLVAAALMPPILLLMVAIEWPASAALLIGMSVLLMAAFCGAIVVFARHACAIDPAPGTARVPASTLVARLHSLAAPGRPLHLLQAAAHDADVALEIDAAEGHAHRVLLVIDARAGLVHVRERLGASAATPRSSDEASMRSIGDAAFDPTRPEATRLSSRSTQATQIDPAPLAAVRLAWSEDGLTVTQADAGGADGRALVTLLAALVTRSGYAWRPRLFGRA
jgi:hypothetical protein